MVSGLTAPGVFRRSFYLSCRRPDRNVTEHLAVLAGRAFLFLERKRNRKRTFAQSSALLLCGRKSVSIHIAGGAVGRAHGPRVCVRSGFLLSSHKKQMKPCCRFHLLFRILVIPFNQLASKGHNPPPRWRSAPPFKRGLKGTVYRHVSVERKPPFERGALVPGGDRPAPTESETRPPVRTLGRGIVRACRVKGILTFRISMLPFWAPLPGPEWRAPPSSAARSGRSAPPPPNSAPAAGKPEGLYGKSTGCPCAGPQ